MSQTLFEKLGITRHEMKLSSGPRVVLFRKKGSPIRTDALLISGSRYDPVGMEGVAHFLEHMIVNGSADFPTKDVLAEHIESVGGSFGAWTSQEAMCVYTEVAEASDFSRACDIFKATLCDPLMKEAVFENERGIVIKEIHRYLSLPPYQRTAAIRELFFKGTPYAHPVTGDEKSISSLSYTKALEEYERFFDTSRITFVCSGDITPEQLTAELERLNLHTGNTFNPDQTLYDFSTEKRLYHKPTDTTQSYLFLGVEAPELFSLDLVRFNLLGQILAGGRSSRLTKRLRYQKGLIYSIGTQRIGGQQIGAAGIVTDTTHDKMQEVIDEIADELHYIYKEGVKESELEFVKNRALKSVKMEMQTAASWVSAHALGETLAPDRYLDIQKSMEIVESTTLADITDVIQRYLTPEKWRLAWSGKNKENEITLP